jgi:integrase
MMQSLAQEELKRLLAVIKDKRNKAVFLPAYRHGLRASDISLLQRTDVELKSEGITVHRPKESLSSDQARTRRRLLGLAACGGT